MSKKRKAVSDGYLNKHWRQAVLARWGYQCAYCGNTDIDIVQAHHIVKRRNVILRWDVRNGIPGCPTCHQYYHTRAGNRWIEEQLDEQTLMHLDTYENMTYKDFLVKKRLTDSDFRTTMLSELKEVSQ